MLDHALDPPFPLRALHLTLIRPTQFRNRMYKVLHALERGRKQSESAPHRPPHRRSDIHRQRPRLIRDGKTTLRKRQSEIAHQHRIRNHENRTCGRRRGKIHGVCVAAVHGERDPERFGRVEEEEEDGGGGEEEAME